MNFDNVEMIRNAQASARKRFDEEHLLSQERIQEALNTETARAISLPRISEVEQMIFKLRSELIDYIVAHGLVDGWILDGVLMPVESGKIVLTSEMIERIIETLGYFQEDDVQAFLEQYLPENYYVSDADYVHTDNNYTDEEKAKLAGIENGAEVNKIIDVIFNGTSKLDDSTRVVTITAEDIKNAYEGNPNTNAFTDALLAKLNGIADGAEKNRVDDVLINGRSVLNDQKKAIITDADIKTAYENNSDAKVHDNERRIGELGDELNSVAGDLNRVKEDVKGNVKAFSVPFDVIKDINFFEETGITQSGAYQLNVWFNIALEDANAVRKRFDVGLVGIANIDETGYIMPLVDMVSHGDDNSQYCRGAIVTMDDSLEPVLTVYALSEVDGFKPVRVLEPELGDYEHTDYSEIGGGAPFIETEDATEADFAIIRFPQRFDANVNGVHWWQFRDGAWSVQSATLPITIREGSVFRMDRRRNSFNAFIANLQGVQALEISTNKALTVVTGGTHYPYGISGFDVYENAYKSLTTTATFTVKFYKYI